jgi:hypothetical protein
VGVQRLEQFPRLRDVAVINHSGIIASSEAKRSPGFPSANRRSSLAGRGCPGQAATRNPSPGCLIWQRSRSSLLTFTIN